jgi:hypothetical protein
MPLTILGPLLALTVWAWALRAVGEQRWYAGSTSVI